MPGRLHLQDCEKGSRIETNRQVLPHSATLLRSQEGLPRDAVGDGGGNFAIKKEKKYVIEATFDKARG